MEGQKKMKKTFLLSLKGAKSFWGSIGRYQILKMRLKKEPHPLYLLECLPPGIPPGNSPVYTSQENYFQGLE